MKALSLWQPHALAIAIELKPWETRDWPTRYRGPLAIHAAKRAWDDAGMWHAKAGFLLALRIRHLVATACPELTGDAFVDACSRLKRRWLAFGAVVCIVDLVDCVPTSEIRGRMSADEAFWGDFSDGEQGKGRYAFRLENVRTFAEPVPYRGAQGFFEFPDSLVGAR